MFNVAKMLYYKFAGMDLERMEELLKLNPDDEKLKERYEMELERNNLHTRRTTKLRKIYRQVSDEIIQKIEAKLVLSEKEGHPPEETLKFIGRNYVDAVVNSVFLSGSWYSVNENIRKFVKNKPNPMDLRLKYVGPGNFSENIYYIDHAMNSFQLYSRYSEMRMEKDNKDVLYYDPFKKKYEVGSIYDFIGNWVGQNYEFNEYKPTPLEDFEF